MLPISDQDLLILRSKRVRNKLFVNRLYYGESVAVRLNLNYRVRKDGKVFSVQTIHCSTPTGRVLGYDHSATVRNATFFVNQAARARIAGGRHKHAMAAVLGDLADTKPSLMGVEVRFNPKTSHLFTRADDGRAVKSAEEVTIFNTRAYARGTIEYWGAETAPEVLEGIVSDARFE